MSIICLRSGMMKTVPRMAPAMAARVRSQKLASEALSVNPSRMRTGTVKMTPELDVFTALATVWTMLVSTTVPLRRILRMPNPSTAAMADPPIVNPILRPA